MLLSDHVMIGILPITRRGITINVDVIRTWTIRERRVNKAHDRVLPPVGLTLQDRGFELPGVALQCREGAQVETLRLALRRLLSILLCEQNSSC
jgi:hypothetical protein